MRLISGATPPLMSFERCGNGLKKARISGVTGRQSVLAYAAGGLAGGDAGKREKRRATRCVEVGDDEITGKGAKAYGLLAAFEADAVVADFANHDRHPGKTKCSPDLLESETPHSFIIARGAATMKMDVLGIVTLVISVMYLIDVIAAYLGRRTIRDTKQFTEELTISTTAAMLAAPHLSPSADHIEENIVILKHWDGVTREYFRRQYRG